MPAPPTGGNAPAPAAPATTGEATAKVVAQSGGKALLEVTCSCGRKIVVECELEDASANPPAGGSGEATERQQEAPQNGDPETQADAAPQAGVPNVPESQPGEGTQTPEAPQENTTP